MCCCPLQVPGDSTSYKGLSRHILRCAMFIQSFLCNQRRHFQLITRELALSSLINHKLKKKWVIEQHLCVSDRLVLCVAVSWLQKKESFQRIVKEVKVVEEMFDGQYAVLLSVTGNSHGKRTTIVILSKWGKEPGRLVLKGPFLQRRLQCPCAMDRRPRWS